MNNEIRWPIQIINLVDKTKFSCNTPTDSAPQFLYKLTRFIPFIKEYFMEIYLSYG